MQATVRRLGVSESAPLMILEYMQYGDLHGFLVKNRYTSTIDLAVYNIYASTKVMLLRPLHNHGSIKYTFVVSSCTI